MKLYHLVPFACSPKTFVSPFCKHHFLNMMTPMLLTRVSYIKLIGRECLNFAVNIAQHWNPPTTLWTNNIFADDCYHHVETWDVNKDNITNYYHAQLCIHRKLIWGAPCHNMYSDDDISQGGCGRGDGQTVFLNRSEKTLSPKKVQKSLWKKSERARKALVNQLCIMHSFCINYA